MRDLPGQYLRMRSSMECRGPDVVTKTFQTGRRVSRCLRRTPLEGRMERIEDTYERKQTRLLERMDSPQSTKTGRGQRRNRSVGRLLTRVHKTRSSE